MHDPDDGLDGMTGDAWREFERLSTPEEYADFFAREDIWEDGEGNEDR